MNIFDLLTESRISVLTTKFESKYNDPAKIKKIIAIDPSQNNQFSEWLLRLGLKDKNIVEDSARIRGDLELFIKFKSKLPLQKRDINKFKTQGDLYDAVKDFGEVKSGKELKSTEKDKIYKDIKILYKGSAGIIAVPKTKEASCFLGRGTRWCTASKNNNMFSDYKSRGDLYILIHKDGTKWQFHLDMWDLMDAADKSLDLDKIRSNDLFKQWINVIKPIIVKDGGDSLFYARYIQKGRFPKGEKAISREQYTSFVYAKFVLKGRFPAGEKTIAKSSGYSISYSEDVLKARFPAGEKAINKIPKDRSRYIKHFNLSSDWTV